MDYKRDLKEGMSGEDVFYIKNRLFDLGYYAEDIKQITSKTFRKDTTEAVLKLQKEQGFVEDGVITETVWNRIEAIYNTQPSQLDEFIAYLKSFADRAIYIWGGQTQVIRGGIVYKDDTFTKELGKAEDWIKKAETSTKNANRALKLYNSRKNTFEVIPCVDCSGYGTNWLYNKKRIASSDMTANGMKAKCTMINKSDLKRGDWVFRIYTSGDKKGRAYHIGYVIDEKLNVAEAKGRDDGAIIRPFDSDYWNAYGRPSYFADEINEEISYRIVFTRVLKNVSPRMNGDDVMALQVLLNEATDADLGVDGIFGRKTERAVMEYQELKGLKVDGKAGEDTITTLGGIWTR